MMENEVQAIFTHNEDDKMACVTRLHLSQLSVAVAAPCRAGISAKPDEAVPRP